MYKPLKQQIAHMSTHFWTVYQYLEMCKELKEHEDKVLIWGLISLRSQQPSPISSATKISDSQEECLLREL